MKDAQNPSSWLKDERARLAEDRILNAAGEAFVKLGVAQTSMEDVAQFASCSRGTIYRYFKNRHELRLAYIVREAQRVHEKIREATDAIEDPAEAILEAMAVALAQVRGNPTLAPWFNAEAQGTTNLVVGSSETIFQLSAGYLSNLFEPAVNAGRLKKGLNREDAAEWITRIMMSLLTVRGPRLRTSDDEMNYLRTFLLPVLFEPTQP